MIQRKLHRRRIAGFNGAAAFPPRRFEVPGERTQATIASMGPQRFRRGDTILISDIEFCWLASMGPQRFRRGDASHRLGRGQGQRASMGPQRFRRGDSTTAGAMIQLIRTLQWGRSVSAAEIAGTNGANGTQYYMLQWGRSVSAAEISLASRSGATPRSGFNGAAAFPPRRSQPTPVRRCTSNSLQWGRSVSAAEITPTRARCCGRLLLQWGRSVSAAEMARGPLPRRSCGASFNGAAAFPPRR